MAHRGTKQNTNASQFFISLQPQKEFDNVYTCFGEILTQHRYVPSINDEISVGTLIEVGAEIGESGERVLKALEAAAAEVDEKNGVLNKNVKITGATVLYNPFAEGVMSL
ncbi:peptidylprolyl isomerase [Angomonas deanei]|nr:peptidylprolyl isomerase [Angomonas deanei]|eukprot:EPY30735.1 peptidylprolyl isomerase [Angomonas deanei]